MKHVSTPRVRARLAVPVAALLLLALAACASTPMPAAPMAVAEAAVQHASTPGTRQDAPAELQVAVDKLARAKAALAADEPKRAIALADEAELDAQVAEMHAQAVRSRRAARESQDADRVLREEMSRKVKQ
jgi:hypothetical protein